MAGCTGSEAHGPLAGLIRDCVAAVGDDPTHRSVRRVLTAAFADSMSVRFAVGAPTGPKLEALHRSDALTILNVVWKAGQANIPHDHRTWAVIGIYQGQEDNVFWRRIPGAPDGRIEKAGEKSLFAGDVTALGPEIIHSVVNPIDGLTGAIHVYGGDFFAIDRSEWDAATLAERPYDTARSRAAFGVSEMPR